MSKYRKKPVVIEAEQYRTDKPLPFHNVVCYDGERFYVPTLEGDMTVTDGDWIIKGVKGEFYPCKPDIFEMTYEAAEAADE